jgi:hypothetical protein
MRAASREGGTQRLMAKVKDAVIRHRARPRLYATPFDRFRVSVARSSSDYREAFRLVQIAYAWLGIDGVSGPTMRITPQHVLPEATVFIARDEKGRLVGTMTVTLDSDAALPLDNDYPEALAELRAPGRRLAEYGSLAVIQRCKHAGVTTLLAMAANAFSLEVLKATHVVMGVHPKVAPLYRAIYDFSPLGKARSHAALEAPVQGMVQELETLEAFLRRHFCRLSEEGVPFYRHYFDALPRCVQLPPTGDIEQLARWKLSRPVFRELFVKHTDRLETLDRVTRAQLDRWRSPRTTEVETSATRPGVMQRRPARNITKRSLRLLPT